MGIRDLYIGHRYRAKQRGIKFTLTLEEWVSIWVSALGPDWLSKRGRGRDKYCMARHGDRGPYAVGNVKITTNAQNAAEVGWPIEKRTKHSTLMLDVMADPMIRVRCSPLPPGADHPSRYALSISGYQVESVKAWKVSSVMPVLNNAALLRIMEEVAGELRAIWALLSCINDLPCVGTDAVSRGSFLGGGRIRKFLDHQVITLKIPGSQRTRRLAARLVVAARRRAHEVRGHWRRDWRHPGERNWVREHQRGDAGLGFVTHDYEVVRGEGR